MTVDKKSVILVLVFTCGLLFGAVLAVILPPQQVHPAKLAVYSENAPAPIGPYSQVVQVAGLPKGAKVEIEMVAQER